MSGGYPVNIVPAASSARARPRAWLSRAVCTRPGSRAGLVIPAAVLVWGAAAGVTLGWPDQTPWDTTAPVGAATGGLAALLLLAALGGLVHPAIRTRLHRVGPWLLVLGVLAVAWQVTTAKLALLPLPYFPPP